MSDLMFTEQASAPSTPAANKVKLYLNNQTTPQVRIKDDGGLVTTLLDDKIVLSNHSTADQTGFATDTYLTGSGITIPAGRLVAAGFHYHLIFDMVKTAAGTATAALTIRFGTAGTTADTARLTFTFTAGSAVADTGTFEVWAHFRTVGSGTSAVLVGVAQCRHQLAATGLTTGGTGGSETLIVTSGGFDSTVASSIIGASFNGGAAFSGTNILVEAKGFNLKL